MPFRACQRLLNCIPSSYLLARHVRGSLLKGVPCYEDKASDQVIPVSDGEMRNAYINIPISHGGNESNTGSCPASVHSRNGVTVQFVCKDGKGKLILNERMSKRAGGVRIFEGCAEWLNERGNAQPQKDRPIEAFMIEFIIEGHARTI